MVVLSFVRADTSSATFFRQLGGTLGVAVFLSLLFSTLGDDIAAAFRSEGPGLLRAARAGDLPRTAVDDAVLAGLQRPGQGGGVFASVEDDSSIIGRMSSAVAHPFKVGFADSMSLVLLCGGGVMLLTFLVLLLLPAVELRATSASAAARAEHDAGRSGPSAPPVEDRLEGGAHRADVAVVTTAAGRHLSGRHSGEPRPGS